METKLKLLPVDERIKLVEDLWDSIAADQSVLRLTTDQKAELDLRLDAYANIPNGFAVIHRSVRRALLHRFPFAVFYVLGRDGVVVLGILHGSRHPRFWMNRV